MKRGQTWVFLKGPLGILFVAWVGIYCFFFFLLYPIFPPSLPLKHLITWLLRGDKKKPSWSAEHRTTPRQPAPSHLLAVPMSTPLRRRHLAQGDCVLTATQSTDKPPHSYGNSLASSVCQILLHLLQPRSDVTSSLKPSHIPSKNLVTFLFSLSIILF